jgi:hypothetical protein
MVTTRAGVGRYETKTVGTFDNLRDAVKEFRDQKQDLEESTSFIRLFLIDNRNGKIIKLHKNRK